MKYLSEVDSTRRQRKKFSSLEVRRELKYFPEVAIEGTQPKADVCHEGNIYGEEIKVMGRCGFINPIQVTMYYFLNAESR